MIEKLIQKPGNSLGYRVFGKITNEDYTCLLADLNVVGREATQIKLLLDLEAFDGEETQDPNLGLHCRCGKKIAKLAIVGDMKWSHWLQTFVERISFSSETHFFPVDEHESAWAWLQS